MQKLLLPILHIIQTKSNGYPRWKYLINTKFQLQEDGNCLPLTFSADINFSRLSFSSLHVEDNRTAAYSPELYVEVGDLDIEPIAHHHCAGSHNEMYY